MINKIFSQEEINVYNFSYRNDVVLQSMLADFQEISWMERVNGFREGVIKTTNVKGLNLENRHLVVSFVSMVKSYLQEKSKEFIFPLENVFLKLFPETSYTQQFTNPALVDTLCIIYVANDNHAESSLTFLNKDISIPLLKGNLIIFPSSEEYAFRAGNVLSGELIIGLSYLEFRRI